MYHHQISGLPRLCSKPPVYIALKLWQGTMVSPVPASRDLRQVELQPIDQGETGRVHEEKLWRAGLGWRSITHPTSE